VTAAAHNASAATLDVMVIVDVNERSSNCLENKARFHSGTAKH